MDITLLLDTLSPSLPSHPLYLPLSLPSIFPFSLFPLPLTIIIPPKFLRIAVLCLSACARSVCIIVAGGSKTALTIHFATPRPNHRVQAEGGVRGRASVKGDVGDLNAKDASKETVLGLLGMLVRFPTQGLRLTK